MTSEVKFCRILFYVVQPQLLAPHSLPTSRQYTGSWVQSTDNESRASFFCTTTHRTHLRGWQSTNKSSHDVSTPVHRSGIRPVLKYLVQSLQMLRSILSSQFNDEKLSSKTLPTVSRQVRGKAKIWTQESPTTLLLFLVVELNQTGLNV